MLYFISCHSASGRSHDALNSFLRNPPAQPHTSAGGATRVSQTGVPDSRFAWRGGRPGSPTRASRGGVADRGPRLALRVAGWQTVRSGYRSSVGSYRPVSISVILSKSEGATRSEDTSKDPDAAFICHSASGSSHETPSPKKQTRPVKVATHFSHPIFCAKNPHRRVRMLAKPPTYEMCWPFRTPRPPAPLPVKTQTNFSKYKTKLQAENSGSSTC